MTRTAGFVGGRGPPPAINSPNDDARAACSDVDSNNNIHCQSHPLVACCNARGPSVVVRVRSALPCAVDVEALPREAEEQPATLIFVGLSLLMRQ